jgi:general stress protein 26
MKSKIHLLPLACLFLFAIAANSQLNAQPSVNRDTILLAAHEIINETNYCGLVTIDTAGRPQIRTMNPFPVKDDFVIWFATARTSRKVREIKNNPDVCVYFANHISALGYVNLNGSATVIDDKELLVRMKRDYWDGINDWQNRFVLIRVVPGSIEVINYKHGINNDPNTLRAPSVTF